ncbi:MAG: class III extradiol ring-cleavage dioxygenase [Ghiorsea sp.]
MAQHQPRVLYLSHGGGPLPILGDESHQEMIKVLQQITRKIKKPSAIIMVSAHWEEDIVSITSASNPPLIYDYYGFPEEAYSISYPCLGSPELAKKVHQMFEEAGLHSQLDRKRGFDHGLFIPLKIMYPDADIPCIQISLNLNLDAATHINLGKALTNIDTENLLFIGSGFSFHNMKAFFSSDEKHAQSKNIEFDEWLIETCSSQQLDEKQREQRLINWEQAPSARYCHPREEHLLPLHVCYGLAQGPCSEPFKLSILNKKASMYLW